MEEKVSTALPPHPFAASLFFFLLFLTPASSSSSPLPSLASASPPPSSSSSSSSSSLSAKDVEALLAFKSAADVAAKLTSWNASDPDPCSTWYGISCSAASPAAAASAPRRVVRLVLEDLSLSGTGFPAITALDQLRVLSFKGNLLSGPLPDLSPLAALKLLFLSNNAFSGPLPLSATSLPPRLYRLDLARNNLSGPVPAAALNRLTHLLTLRLDGNHLSGPISGLDLPNLQDLNISSNLLTGAIPRSLAAFPASAFAGNPGLCGSPLTGCADIVRADPTRPGSATATPSPSSPAATAVVSSSPSTKPMNGAAATDAAPSAVTSDRRPSGRMSRVAVVALVVGDFAVLVLIAGLLFCYFWRKFSSRGATSRLHEGEKIVYSSSPYTAASHGGGGGAPPGPGFDRGKMVFFEGTKRFELEDLLRASAEMLGKGGYGTTYKAVLEDGGSVAVKRLRDLAGGGGGQHSSSALGRREFEQHMEALGRLRHSNLVSLRACYSARDEKLLVYDFMPNGSLFSLLHGNRGPGRTPLDWATRVRIAAGAARGLAYLHQVCRSSPKIAHGNLKSTNVLLDKSGAARVADFGLASLAGGAPATGSLARANNGYRAPELAADPRKAATSHKADVYAFGVLLLELLTGKHPSPCGPENGGGAGAAAPGGGGTAVDLPRWVQSVVREEWTAEVFDLELMRYKDVEEEMVGLLQIAMSCTGASPDQRPKMSNVVKMIDELRGVDGSASPSQDSFDSVSDSPFASDDASACRNRRW